MNAYLQDGDVTGGVDAVQGDWQTTPVSIIWEFTPDFLNFG